MDLVEQLRVLANGINPETGEILDKNSETNKPEVIRALFNLAEELELTCSPTRKRLTDEEKMAKNVRMGRPARSHFRWSDEEKGQLEVLYDQNRDIKELASVFQRSVLAIAVQLERLGKISTEELDAMRY